jgi:hypothetical protein
MKAIPSSASRWRWEVKDGNDTVTIWIDESGIHTQRKTELFKLLPRSLSFTDVISQAEGQKKLL